MSVSNDLGVWYKSIPPITRVWFTAAAIVPLTVRMRLLSEVNMLLFIHNVIYDFQIWRLFTCVIYYRVGFNYLINLFFIYQYSARLESSTFSGKPADYIFCLFFLWICNVFVGSLLSLFIVTDALTLSVIYIWCQLNKEAIMSFWFGMQFKAMYMPWVILLFNWIVRGSCLPELCGIVVGHLYFFLVFKYPQDFGGARLLQTPNFLYRFFPNERSGVSGFGTAPIPRRQADPDDNDANRGRRIFGGRGHVLGNN